MRKLFLITAILVIVYLAVRNSEPYARIVDDLSKGFNAMWSAMVKG